MAVLPAIVPPPRPLLPIDDAARDAARIIRDAARTLAVDPAVEVDASRCRRIAALLSAALTRPGCCRADLLAASPFVVERSGRARTLMEMIEEDPGDDDAHARLARLLLRVLTWE